MLHVEIYSLISDVIFDQKRHYFALLRHPYMPRCDECIFCFSTLLWLAGTTTRSPRNTIPLCMASSSLKAKYI